MDEVDQVLARLNKDSFNISNEEDLLRNEETMQVLAKLEKKTQY